MSAKVGHPAVGWWMLGASGAFAALALALGIANSVDSDGNVDSGSAGIAWAVGGLAFPVAGALILSRFPRHRIGWLFSGVGLLNALAVALYAYGERAVIVDPGSLPAAETVAWLAAVAVLPPVPLLATFGFLLFPDGRPVSPGWRRVGWVAGAAILLVTLHTAFAPGFPEGAIVENPYPIAAADYLAIAWPVVSLCAVASVASLVLRYRRAAALERQQIRWVAAAGAVFGFGLLGDSIYSAVSDGGELPALPLIEIALVGLAAAVAVAILRYRLYELDLVVNRTLVYGLLTGVVMLGYVGIVTGLGAVLDSSGIGVSLVATASVAVAIQPLRAFLQGRVDRLMYGDRDDPYRALARLGERLGSSLDPDAVLPTIVAAVAEGLRLPYVAIELGDGERFAVAAEHGANRGGEPEPLLLEYRGSVVGRLLVAPRSPSEPLTDSDRRLLGDLARQAGVAAHAVALTADLRRSRERLVATREEERRRLRRDLHDGLGPTLAGIALQIESARALVEADPNGARALLGGLKGDVQDAIADIRRIAHDLRPPALDELGLVAAVREHAARLGSNGATPGSAGSPAFTIDAPAQLPPLAAAVEVAAYRIALEAMTNACRHASARRCRVRITVNGALELTVIDDGCGLGERARGVGVGLTSMRERAEELGGRLEVGGASGGGTRVCAELPLEGP